MAYYEHLPIYKKAMDLAVEVEKAVRGFSRYNKYSIGTDLREVSKEVLLTVIQANSMKEKVEELTRLREVAERLKILLQIGKELKVYKNFGQFERLSLLAVDVCRQAEGWLKSQKGNGRNHEPVQG